ncbi:MAG: squalene--hopene cyclase, partial [Phycisphaerae bacterium]|nr:squalene--hopene cyclase [Phycisphaerae bacterium]
MPVKTSSGLREAVAQCVHNGVAALRSLQRSDGHWCGLLQGDSILESEYLLMKFILSQENEPMRDGSGRETLDRIAAGLRRQQRPDGTWGQYPGSDMDINASVKGYFALKLMGDAPDAPHMVAGREAILAAGGAERINTFSNFYLACLGQVSWNAVPSIPPEIIWLPRWFYFHMSKVSAWTRTMILPLAIVTALRPTRELPKDVHINELFIDDRARHRLSRSEETPGLWSIFFSLVDSSLKLAHRVGTSPFRRLAVHRCLEWILRRASQDGEAATDGLGAIFPPMVYIQVALQALGWDRSDPVLRRAEKDLDDFFVEKSDDHGDWIMIQPCFSPVWDTG